MNQDWELVAQPALVGAGAGAPLPSPTAPHPRLEFSPSLNEMKPEPSSTEPAFETVSDTVMPVILVFVGPSKERLALKVIFWCIHWQVKKRQAWVIDVTETSSGGETPHRPQRLSPDGAAANRPSPTSSPLPSLQSITHNPYNFDDRQAASFPGLSLLKAGRAHHFSTSEITHADMVPIPWPVICRLESNLAFHHGLRHLPSIRPVIVELGLCIRTPKPGPDQSFLRSFIIWCAATFCPRDLNFG